MLVQAKTDARRRGEFGELLVPKQRLLGSKREVMGERLLAALNFHLSALTPAGSITIAAATDLVAVVKAVLSGMMSISRLQVLDNLK